MSRKDFYYDPKAPAVTSVRPAAAVALFNEREQVLLLRRKDNDKWTLPGGTLEFGESLVSCAIREVKEECGLDIEIEALIGTYTDPNIVVAYADGEVRQEFSFVYLGTVKGGTLALDQESTAFQWMTIDEAMSHPLAASQRRRLEDVREFRASGKVFLK